MHSGVSSVSSQVGQKGVGLQGCMRGVTDGQRRGEGYSCPSLSSSLLGWGCWVALAPSPDSKAPSQTGKQANFFPRHCDLYTPVCGTSAVVQLSHALATMMNVTWALIIADSAW